MKEFFARLILNFIFVLGIVIAYACGIGIFIALLEYAWDIMILCMVLCPLGAATAITIWSIK